MTSGTVSYSSTNVPRLKEAPTVTNIGFNFVANERTIVINLTDKAEELEGTTVDFTVKAVLDANGNESEAIHWTAFVKQNQLLWKGDTDVTVEKQVGETATFDAVIVNEGGTSENWMLSGLPAWLSANIVSGTLAAQQQKTITFTIDESTAVGKYEQTVYLTGNNNISEPLTLSLKVKSEEPDWAVNPNDYMYDMNIVGLLKFQGQLSTDEDDMVAAFNEDGDCVGVAHPQYEAAFDSYFTMMTVYSNNTADSDALTFKAFDASTGKVCPVVDTDDEVYFEKDTRLGKLSAPFVWNATDKIEQVVDLKEGWNWMSLYVTPEDLSPASVLAGADSFLNIVNGPSSTSELDPSLGWFGSLTEMDNSLMYKLHATADGQTTIVGSPADVAGTTISVKKNGLTWIGYPVTFTLSPADAFADLAPEDDDMVKSQNAFAVYYGVSGMWVGSLKTMEPGKGYMYSSAATTDKTFTYPSTAPASAHQAPAYNGQWTMDNGQSLMFSPVAAEAYPGNMVVIAQVVQNGLPVSGVEVGVFADDECRAAICSDSDGYLFLLVPGSKSRPLELRAVINGEEVVLGETLNYQTDGRIGTLSKPLVLDITGMATGIGDATIISQPTEDVYDLSGRKRYSSKFSLREGGVASKVQSSKLNKGVYIVNGRKTVK